MEYTKGTIEVYTIVGEIVRFLHLITEEDVEKQEFVGKMVKLLPLLYLKTTLVEVPEEAISAVQLEEVGGYITEGDYEDLRNNIIEILGSDDNFLSVSNLETEISDTPVLNTVSECLCDLFQSMSNFVGLCQSGESEAIAMGIAYFVSDFREYWGSILLNALGALHNIYINNINSSSNGEA
ncbi:MAG: DUF5063 domain-containing protein [Paludibacteraceae bacterium]|nr:DUF5063 domain-containing protein [Paludibacteraceae bacterium]